MKIVSVMLIIAYLLLPALCFGHPCDDLSADAHHGAVELIQSDECPVGDSDNCETACCCAGHLPVSPMDPCHLEFTKKTTSYEPCLALPRILARIFVPPEDNPTVALHHC
jgi:hypothetical protein